ncbi:MAG TPA: copper-transporting ATPase, partial [Rhodospirillales bacterium]|nr:copper-transporting ATPase [Rhodospirillales bacterium]
MMEQTLMPVEDETEKEETCHSHNAGHEQSIRLGIKGMNCASCVTSIENALSNVPGVVS